MLEKGKEHAEPENKQPKVSTTEGDLVVSASGNFGCGMNYCGEECLLHC